MNETRCARIEVRPNKMEVGRRRVSESREITQDRYHWRRDRETEPSPLPAVGWDATWHREIVSPLEDIALVFVAVVIGLAEATMACEMYTELDRLLRP